MIRQIEDILTLVAEDPKFLSDIVAPTLIFNSSRDRIIDAASGDWLHERIANSDRVLLDTDDHFMWLGDRWVEVCSMLVEFFTGTPIVAEAEGLHIRAGIHSGEVELRPNGDITGYAVNLAARVERAADDGAIWVSSTVRDMLMGGSHNFAERGEHTLKGFEDSWRLYELASA